jgi:hypothetical protein
MNGDIPTTVEEVLAMFRDGPCTPQRAEIAIKLAYNAAVLKQTDIVIANAKADLARMEARP